MNGTYYDKIAKKFGGYGYGVRPKYKTEYPDLDPEKIFKEKLLELSSKSKTAIDIGCADGKFTISIAPHFKRVYGIDNSRINLDVAKSHNEDARSKNVEYSFQNAQHTSFKDSFFDLVYSRRGPSYPKEYYRILKTKGYYVYISIGEKDTMDLKKIFGRGQDYGKWNKSALNARLMELKDLGFAVVFAEDFYYNEYYPSYKQLDLFLQGVPIFEDFDSEKDKNKLQKYVEKFSTDKGILLPRHRFVFVVQKL